MSFYISIARAVEQLEKETTNRFTVLMKHGSMSVEYYAPRQADTQTPHRQDEIYVIASGSGTFLRGAERVAFTTGDVLFVPAQVEHRFENFSDDFATWVFFYGADGGEKEQPGAGHSG
jgi:mannose-6-phosphate isomerase-like protein (cupin superfamily)